MDNTLSVTIIIPNWNGSDLLKKHLPNVIKHSGDASILVVDDGSIDDSVRFLEKNYPQIQVLKKVTHDGFASTVNAGVSEALADIVVLLNSDIEPEKDYLRPLLSHFSDPKVFAVGSMDKSMENGNVVLRGRGIGWWRKGFYYHKRGEVNGHDTAWVSGGSGAFRRSMWNELGGMDSKFNPFYWEDIDLSYRAVRHGYKIVFEPKSIVIHYHEEGKIRTDYSKDQIARIAFRNQYFFIWKHASLNQFILHIIWNPVRTLQSLIKGDANMLVGFFVALPTLPGILLGRLLRLS